MASTVVSQLPPGELRSVLIVLGLATPERRFVAATAAAGIALYAFKQPAMCFKEGRVRNWSAISSELDATPVHFLVFPIVAGVLASTLL